MARRPARSDSGDCPGVWPRVSPRRFGVGRLGESVVEVAAGPVFLQLVAKRADGDVEQLGGAGAVAAGGLQGGEDGALFHFVEGDDGLRGGLDGRRGPGREGRLVGNGNEVGMRHGIRDRAAGGDRRGIGRGDRGYGGADGGGRADERGKTEGGGADGSPGADVLEDFRVGVVGAGEREEHDPGDGVRHRGRGADVLRRVEGAEERSVRARHGAAADEVGKVLERISELKTLYADPTKNATDLANYDAEFTGLQAQLTALTTEKFNGNDLFGGAATFAVAVTEDGATTVTLAARDLGDTIDGFGEITAGAVTDLGDIDLSDITTAIQNVATFRAQNGAEQSRLGFASELITINKANLEAASSRIVDVDVAEESTQLARWNTLVQAGTAMLAQANGSAQTALRLLQ